LAGHTEQAVTINADLLTLGGPPLSFTGNASTHSYDVCDFTLPYDILAGKKTKSKAVMVGMNCNIWWE